MSLFGDEDTAKHDEIEDMADAAAGGEDDLPQTPRTTYTLTGHDDVEKQLLKGHNAGRLPHAIILSGPAGIGKATLSFRLARFLLSEGSGGGGLFGEAAPATSLDVAADHPVSRRIASGGHADLLTIERPFDEKKGRHKKDIPVEEVRKVAPFLRKTAAEGGWRVVIVDGAEGLNRSSQNALLKILEEPPKQALLILATSKPGLFLPTVRSRCRHIQMEPLPVETVEALLAEKLSQVGEGERKMLAALSDGSIGRALQLQEEGGVDLYRSLLGFLGQLPQLDLVQIHELSGKLGAASADRSYRTMMELLTWWLGRMARAQARGGDGFFALEEERSLAAKLGAAYPAAHWLDAWNDVSELIARTDRSNLDRRQAVLGAFQAIAA